MDRQTPIDDHRTARGGWGTALLALVVLIAAAPGAEAISSTRDPAPHRLAARVWPGAIAKAVLRIVGCRSSSAAPEAAWRPLAAVVPAPMGQPAAPMSGPAAAHLRAALLSLPPPALRV